MPLTSCDVVVLDARLRQSLVTVRSLGRRGLGVAAVDSPLDVPAFSSRWCHRQCICHARVATDAYLEYLDRLLSRLDAPVVIPSHDGTIALIRRRRSQLEQRAAIALAKEPALGIAIDKERTLAIARRLGIAVPETVIVRQAGDVPFALRQIGLPAVVKPVESWSWNDEGGVRVGAQVVTTADEAYRVVAELALYERNTLFQGLLTGRREAVSVLYANGRIHARFAQWAKRTGPPLGGESVLRQSIAVPRDLGEQAERLIREIDLEGYSEIEFRRDDRGVPYLMEINPRLSASVEIAVRCGVDFPHLLYQWASGQPIETVERYRVGAWTRYLRGDFMTTIAALRERGRPGVPPPFEALVGFGLSFFRPMGYDYVDWQDPVPAIAAARWFMRDMVRSLTARNPFTGGSRHAAAFEAKESERRAEV